MKKIKKMFSVTLALALLLSLFAGCTPADVPSTGDSSVDASVTDSNTSDTSSSETDGVISETNTDASTDTSTDSSTTDIYTNIGTSTNTESSEPVVEKTTLTMEDLRTIVYGVTFEETTFDYFDKLFGKEGQNVGSGIYIMGWDFDNLLFRAYPIKTDRITMRRFLVTPPKNVYYDMKTVQEWLLSLGIAEDEGALEFEESVDDRTKEKSATYVYLLSLPQKKIKIKVRFSTFEHMGPSWHIPNPGEYYLSSIAFSLPDYPA